MPFDDDLREPFAVQPFEFTKATTNTMLVAPDRFERAAMAAFCASLSPDDWLALEALGQRVRNAMLRQTVRIALRWRARRKR